MSIIAAILAEQISQTRSQFVWGFLVKILTTTASYPIITFSIPLPDL